MKIFLVVILFLALFLRVYALGIIPPGLTNDEADIGYDAYSVLRTGKDQWGQFLPLTSFKGFGDHRLPLYTYLVVPSIATFGVTPLAVRLPSALFGTISVLFIYFFIKKLFEKISFQGRKRGEIIALVAAFLFAISPWSVGLSRIGIESNVAIAILLAALISFLYAFKKPVLFFFSSLLFALTLYTYTSYVLFTPMVIVSSLLFYKKELKSYKKHIVFSAVLFLVLVLPLFIFKSTAGVRAGQVTFFNSQDRIGLLANLNDRRGSCVTTFTPMFCKVMENKQVVFVNTFTRNYLNHFSPTFLYLNGATNQYSILPARSLFYTIGVFFLLLGIFFTFKTRNKHALFVLTLLLLSPIPDSLTSDGHYSRASTMIPFICIIEGLGVVSAFSYLLAFKRKKLSYVPLFIICSVLLFSFLSFVTSYLTYFPKYYSTFTQFGYEDWAKKVSSKQGDYDRIYLSKLGNDTKQYAYYLFYTKYDPARFQQKKNVAFSVEDGGWVSIDKIDNVYFVDRIPSEDQLNELKDKKILLVTSLPDLPKQYPAQNLEKIKDKNGNTIFAFISASNLLDYLNSTKVSPVINQ